MKYVFLFFKLVYYSLSLSIINLSKNKMPFIYIARVNTKIQTDCFSTTNFNILTTYTESKANKGVVLYTYLL